MDGETKRISNLTKMAIKNKIEYETTTRRMEEEIISCLT